MATTHMLAGMALAMPVWLYAPELGPVVLLAGLFGGALPDLDLYLRHRRTLHFPVLYPAAAGIVAILAVLSHAWWMVALAVALSAAALHTTADLFGGGLELEPWRGTSVKGVYSHVHGRWLPPRRLIGYDGSPGDLALAGVVATPLLLGGDPTVQWLALVLLGISAVYVILRKRLARVATALVGLMPERALPYVPERYVTG